MSTASKVTLGLTSAATLAIIYSVHYSQVQDRQKLHQGVVRYITHSLMRLDRAIHIVGG